MTKKVKVLLRKYHTKVTPDTPLERVWHLLYKKVARLLPVVAPDNTLLGVITDEDLLYHLIPDYREYFSDFYPQVPDLEDLEDKLEREIKLTAMDVMNKSVQTIDAEQEICRALSKMIAHQVRQLPVLDENKKYLGMIIEDDIFRHLFEKHQHLVKRKRKVKSKSK